MKNKKIGTNKKKYEKRKSLTVCLSLQIFAGLEMLCRQGT